MTLAGDTARCVAYLMGNHVKAEATYRHDPNAMLYVPMRTVITRRDGEQTWFTFDQPSSQLGSLGTLPSRPRAVRSIASSPPCWTSSTGQHPAASPTGMSATESRAAG
jgi:hypothetical protein